MLLNLLSPVVLVASRVEQEAETSKQLPVLIKLDDHGLLVLVAQNLPVNLLELLEHFVGLQIVVGLRLRTFVA